MQRTEIQEIAGVLAGMLKVPLEGVESRLRDLEAKMGQEAGYATPSWSPDEVELMSKSIGQEMAQELDRRHPAGLCEDPQCGPCREQRLHLNMQVLSKIEERIPGTKEQLARWEMMNTPIEVLS